MMRLLIKPADHFGATTTPAADRSTPAAVARAERQMAHNWIRAAQRVRGRCPDRAARFLALACQHLEEARINRAAAAQGEDHGQTRTQPARS